MALYIDVPQTSPLSSFARKSCGPCDDTLRPGVQGSRTRQLWATAAHRKVVGEPREAYGATKRRNNLISRHKGSHRNRVDLLREHQQNRPATDALLRRIVQLFQMTLEGSPNFQAPRRTNLHTERGHPCFGQMDTLRRNPKP